MSVWRHWIRKLMMSWRRDKWFEWYQCVEKLPALSHLDWRRNCIHLVSWTCSTWPFQSWFQSLRKSLSSLKTQPSTHSLTCHPLSAAVCLWVRKSSKSAQTPCTQSLLPSSSHKHTEKGIHQCCRTDRRKTCNYLSLWEAKRLRMEVPNFLGCSRLACLSGNSE